MIVIFEGTTIIFLVRYVGTNTPGSVIQAPFAGLLGGI